MRCHLLIPHEFSMVNSYGQKPMEKPWIITHGDFMEFFCKGIAVAEILRQSHTSIKKVSFRPTSPCR